MFFWGAGNLLDFVYRARRKKSCEVLGIVDAKWREKVPFHSFTVQSPEILLKQKFDAVVITTQRDQDIVKVYRDMGLPMERLVCFWRDENQRKKLFHEKNVQVYYLKEKIKRYRCRWENAPFEFSDTPQLELHTAEELLKRIERERVSLTRFGDGEFSLIFGEQRSWFQHTDHQFSKRLMEVLTTNDSKICIGIADNFGSLQKYKEPMADSIREYMTMDHHRERIMKLLRKDGLYYDAYVTRPYIIYRDRAHADNIFCLWNRIFSERDLLIVEGAGSRIGIQNDLLSSARSVKRILCPDQDAFRRYEEILNCTLNMAQPETLVLVSLGAVATVMAYDLTQKGLQAIDIGQIDNEYDWYCMKAKDRQSIPGKMTAESAWSVHGSLSEAASEQFWKEVVAEIH